MDASPNIDGPKVPQLCLSEAAQSSTESEKTVILESQISLATRDKKDLSTDNISSLMTDQTISSENIHLESQSLKSSMLSLPEIVIQPGTPSASSPSAPSSPTSATPSSTSSVSIITATELVAKSMKPQSSAIACSTVLRCPRGELGFCVPHMNPRPPRICPFCCIFTNTFCTLYLI